MMFKKLLIANRGEIAARVARACAAVGITSVAVYSDADRHALHVRACDEAYHIGPAPAAESYLRGDKIIQVALAAGCDAIHPGYGFLSENARFAQAVLDAGLAWVGPPPEAISLMGSKIESKRLAERNGVPVVPGYFGDDQAIDTLVSEAARVGYPLLVKASAGGGGKGMRVVEQPSTLAEAIEGAQREALAAFGDSSVMLEKYLAEPRHIEVQVLGDQHDNLIHLGERDCSIQRRHQKVVEESPSPAIDAEMRARITSSALALARAAGYTNAGTVEFIFQDGEYYFLEMNTRLQVEHPVTEEAIGFDLVQAQIRVAAGEQLALRQESVQFSKHAIEVRLYAEDPERGFLPSTGTITHLGIRTGPNIRVDAGVDASDAISPYYDPMIAKIIASGDDRSEAIRAMRDALGSLELRGLNTNLDFLRWLVAHPQFESGDFSTRFIERYYMPGAFAVPPLEVLAGGAATLTLAPLHKDAKDPWTSMAWRQAQQQIPCQFVVEGITYHALLSRLSGQESHWQAKISQGDTTIYDGKLEIDLPYDAVAAGNFSGQLGSVRLRFDGGEALRNVILVERRECECTLAWQGMEYVVRQAPPVSTETLATAIHVRDEDTLESPMPGKVLKVLAKPGDTVSDNQPLVIIEAMKMEFTVRAPHDGKVAAMHYRAGDQVSVGDILAEMEK
jgi:3-methylcrotonyl-CoA carboxylase alpha subunit